MSILSTIIEAGRVLLGITKPVAPLPVSPTQQEAVMPDANQTGAAPVAATDASDALVANIKKVLTTAGHDVEAVWDEVVALAKKL